MIATHGHAPAEGYEAISPDCRCIKRHKHPSLPMSPYAERVIMTLINKFKNSLMDTMAPQPSQNLSMTFRRGEFEIDLYLLFQGFST